MKLTWLGHSSFRLDCGSLVYFDPYEVEEGEKADIILISHDHYDHCHPDSVSHLARDDTFIVCHPSCMSKLEGSITGVNAGETLEIGSVRIEAVQMYNTNKPNHPPGAGVGYIIESEGKRVYHAGDTDLIPEMKELEAIDAALLPVGGKYTMNWNEAAEAVKLIMPKVAVPMHYGGVVGSLADAVKFRNKVNAETKTKAVILKRGETIQL
jgi:L-ascorbate metabolism protein UlaG (beta-lactamase superfamily)